MNPIGRFGPSLSISNHFVLYSRKSKLLAFPIKKLKLCPWLLLVSLVRFSLLLPPTSHLDQLLSSRRISLVVLILLVRLVLSRCRSEVVGERCRRWGLWLRRRRKWGRRRRREWRFLTSRRIWRLIWPNSQLISPISIARREALSPSLSLIKSLRCVCDLILLDFRFETMRFWIPDY